MQRAPRLLTLPLSIALAATILVGALATTASAATAQPSVKKACTYISLSKVTAILRAPTKEVASLLDKTPFHVIGCTYTAKKAKPGRFFTIAYYPEAGIASVHETAAAYLAAIKERAGTAASKVNGLGVAALAIQGGIDVIVQTKKGWIVAIDGYGPTPNLKAEKAMLSTAIKTFN
jgi:hypothetical protein